MEGSDAQKKTEEE